MKCRQISTANFKLIFSPSKAERKFKFDQMNYTKEMKQKCLQRSHAAHTHTWEEKEALITFSRNVCFGVNGFQMKRIPPARELFLTNTCTSPQSNAQPRELFSSFLFLLISLFGVFFRSPRSKCDNFFRCTFMQWHKRFIFIFERKEGKEKMSSNNSPENQREKTKNNIAERFLQLSDLIYGFHGEERKGEKKSSSDNIF